MKKILTFIALLTASPIFAADKTIVRGTDRFELVYEMTVPKLTAKGTLWIPLANNDAFQKLKARAITSPVAKSGPFNYLFGPHLEMKGKEVPVKATFEFKRLPRK